MITARSLSPSLSVKVICDHVSGKSKGYGFVRFDSETAAAGALKEMDGQVCTSYYLTLHMHSNCCLPIWVTIPWITESSEVCFAALLQLLDGRNIRVQYAEKQNAGHP